MRILMLSAAYAPDGGGVATHVTNLVHGLADRHVQVTVFTLNRPGLSEDKVEGHHLVHIVKQARKDTPAYDGRRVFAEDMIGELLHKWHKIQADIIHCHDFDSLFVGWLLKAAQKNPVVFTLHRAPSPWREKRFLEDPKDLFIQAMMTAATDQRSAIDSIVVPSQASAQSLRDQGFGIAPSVALNVIQHGISQKLPEFKEVPNLLESLGCGPDHVLVFCPCRAEEHKDVEVFLDAACILKRDRSDLRLFFVLAAGVSDPGYKNALTRAKTNKLAPGIDFAFRKFEYEEMATVYRRAKVCVIPSRHESFGLTVLEAFLMGVPVVAANTSALCEIISHRQNGLLFTDGKSKELAMHLETVFDDHELRGKIIQVASAAVSEGNQYSSKRMCDEYLRLYWRILGTQPP